MSSVMSANHPGRRRPGQQRGLSLFELLIAMLVLAALMAGISELVVTNTKNAAATSKLARLQETGRTAMQLLTSDIRRTGYLGGNSFPDLIAGSLGLAAPAATCPVDNTDWATMLEQPVFGLNGTNDGYACVSNDDYLRGDILTVRYTPAAPIDPAAMVDATPYLRTTIVEGRLFLGKDENDGENLLPDDIAIEYPLVAHTYYVGLTNRSCVDEDGDGEEFIPALFRKSVDANGRPATSELLAGVEHLQFRYKVGNQYLDADEVPDWNRGTVEAIRTTVLVRAECPEAGFRNDRTFDMADVQDWGADDRYRRQVFSTVTQLRNMVQDNG